MEKNSNSKLSKKYAEICRATCIFVLVTETKSPFHRQSKEYINKFLHVLRKVWRLYSMGRAD